MDGFAPHDLDLLEVEWMTPQRQPNILEQQHKKQYVEPPLSTLQQVYSYSEITQYEVD